MRLLAALAFFAATAYPMARRPPDTMKVDLTPDDPKPAAYDGLNSAVSQAGVRVVRDESSWKRLWKEAFNQDAPALDFSKFFAVAVFAGLRSTGGFSIEFEEPTLAGDAVEIGYRLKTPAASGFVTQAFTQPYAIRIYRATDRDVRAVERR